MHIEARPRVHAAVAVAAVALALTLAGCSGSGSVEPTTKSITGTWQFESGTDARGALGAQGSSITLKIDGKDSGGHGPCNAYGAQISSGSTGAFAMKRGVTTTMACADQVRNQIETRYFADLAAVDKSSISNGKLVLTGKAVSLTFISAKS